ncbi:MAG: histidine kinase [Polaribacter sp.]|uniref:histidine kinase n=1 Tax=Polaribacter sp. TaxID=1920175 RepID=UPI002F350786
MYAQKPLRFTTKQGLPSNHIYDIQEDADGFMWFATNRGLVKYDGETFKTFTIKDGLPNNDTWLLETDYQDRLWYFSKSNYQGFIKHDSIYKYPIINNKVISPRFIYKSNKNLWMHSGLGFSNLINDTIQGEGIYKNNNIKKLLTILKKANAKLNLRYPKNFIVHNPEINEFLSKKKNDFIFFDKEINLLKKIPLKLKSDYNSKELHNFGLIFNNIFYYVTKTDLIFINFKDKTVKRILFKDLVGRENIKYFRCKGLKNEIQISIPGHLVTFDYDLQVKEKHSFDKTLGRQSYKDTKGNIWLIDFTNGVSLLSNRQTETTYFLKNKKVQKISRIDTELYAGVNDDGFYQLDEKDSFFNKITSIKNQNGEIYQIGKDSLNSVFFVSSMSSFFKIENKIKKLEVFNVFDNWMTASSFKNVVYHQNKYYFLSGGYLYKTDVNYHFEKHISNESGILFSSVFKDKLYYGGSNGMHIIEKDTLVKVKRVHKLLNVSVSNLLATKKQLFVGTDGRGVYRYDESKIVHLKNTDGYSIQKIIKKEDKLWLATNNGVHEISLNNNDLENSKITNSFYESDGLLQNNTNDIYLEKDTLFAASDIGIAKLNVENNIYKQQPKLFFKTKNDTLRFANGARNNIAITFGLQDFVNQEYVKYQYRILPTQKEWITTITKTLNFSNLSPKLYQLEIKVTDQHFNETIIQQYLHVIPAWWQTIVAKIGFGFLAFLGFWLFVKILKQRIQQKETAKADLDKKIAGLELQALRSQMNPHFVHNSLNSIQYYIQRNEVEQSENYLVKFSKLVRMFFEYSRKQNISIKEEVT